MSTRVELALPGRHRLCGSTRRFRLFSNPQLVIRTRTNLELRNSRRLIQGGFPVFLSSRLENPDWNQFGTHED